VWFEGTNEGCATQQEVPMSLRKEAGWEISGDKVIEVSSPALWCGDEDVMKGVFATTWLETISWCWSFMYVVMGSGMKVDTDWEKHGHRNVSHSYLHHLSRAWNHASLRDHLVFRKLLLLPVFFTPVVAPWWIAHQSQLTSSSATSIQCYWNPSENICPTDGSFCICKIVAYSSRFCSAKEEDRVFLNYTLCYL
jgi:hypothetical protein